MSTPTDNTAPARRLFGPRTPAQLRSVASVRFAAGIFLTILGALLISRGADGLAALPLSGAAANFVWGSWQLSMARNGRSPGR